MTNLVALNTSGSDEPQVTVTLTNNRMEDSRWNRLLTILFTPQDAEAEAA
ncbi:hypothetical protein [Streptomyces sp. NPDC059468]